jgi:hypothetical protein
MEIGCAAIVAAAAAREDGFVIDGVHYSGGCPTRHGAYPFCENLDLPSYSLAKSMVAGIALMRLERLYPGAAQSTGAIRVASDRETRGCPKGLIRSPGSLRKWRAGARGSEGVHVDDPSACQPDPIGAVCRGKDFRRNGIIQQCDKAPEKRRSSIFVAPAGLARCSIGLRVGARWRRSRRL